MHVHFSIDDVFESLMSDSNDVTKFINDLGCPVDLYCFYKNKDKNLSDVSNNYFKDNSHIKFGVHALDNDTPPHLQTPSEQIKVFNKIYSEFNRLGFPYSRQIRLHEFSESYELADYFRNVGVKKIFTTDKSDLLWRIPDHFKLLMKKHGYCDYNGIRFIQTNIRIENLIGKDKSKIRNMIDNIYSVKEYPNVMTHEYELYRPEVRKMTQFVIDYLIEKEYYA